MNNIRIRFDEHTAYTRDWLTDHEVQAQRIMADFKTRQAAPVCECSDKLPRMYIAHRTRYYLARNPGTGSLHSPDCPSYEMETEDSGRVTYENDVIKNKNDGSLSLKILAPLSRQKVDRTPGPEKELDEKAPPTAKSPAEKREAMSLNGLLALMWEEAELNRWHPGFNQRRFWAVARKRLMDVAQRLYTKRTNMADVLYIPEHFSQQEKDEIDARRKAAFDSIMTKKGGKTRFMVTIAAVRKMTVTDDTVSIVLNHQSSAVKYWGGKHILKKATAGPAVKIVNADDDPRLVYTLMIVERNEDDVLMIQDIGFLVTDMHMIPTYCEQDRLLTEKLVMEGHKFIKTMRFDGFRNAVYPDYLLVDDTSNPLPLAIYRTFAPESEIEMRFQAQERWKEKYGAYWIWDMEEQGESTIPALP